MSALVCGRSSSSSSLFPKTSSHAHLISKKRLRCSSTSPIQQPSPSTTNKTNTPITTTTSAQSVVSSVLVADTLDRLQFIFPAIEMKVVEKTLEQSDYDFESAIMSLIQLCLGACASSSTDVDDQNDWLFEHQNKRSKQVEVNDVLHVASSTGYANIGTTWPPTACYLQQADVYALPYTMLF